MDAPVTRTEKTQSRALLSTTVRAFSLVEMLVVLSIITIITTITLLSHSKFQQTVILVDTAHTVAMSIREAQFFGLSTRVFSGIQNAGYGIRFSQSTPLNYILFADIYPTAPGSTLSGLCPGHTVTEGHEARPGNCLYDVSHNERANEYTIRGNYTISSVCGRVSATDSRCMGDDFDTVYIVFLRPNTETVITGARGSSYTALQDACIKVKSPSAGTYEKSIYVSKVGQVAVVNDCP